MLERPKRNSNDYINVCVRKLNHASVKLYLEELGDGTHIGKFYEKAATERLAILRQQNNPFNLFNSQVLLSNGFTKDGSSTFKRGNDVVIYSGTNWYYNGEELNKDNYVEKVFLKTKKRTK